MIKLFDSELKVMEVLWEGKYVAARDIAKELKRTIEWDKTTTYTIIRKCIKKGAIKRTDPGFICQPLITREEVQEHETEEFLDKFYKGAADQLVANLINTRLDKKEVDKIKDLINKME